MSPAPTGVAAHPYDALLPEVILDAVEQLGVRCDGSMLALNSYENRVYQVGIEDDEPLIAKFYRPGRWSNEAIAEEHRFAAELAEREIPVITPLGGATGQTLREHAGFRYALYARARGHRPELETTEYRERVGRYLGRIHAVGAIARFSHRPVISIDSVGQDAYRYLMDTGFVPEYLRANWQSNALALLERVTEQFAEVGNYQVIRLHGDCHLSNILWSQTGPVFVDLDDTRTGPAVQDIWMLLSGTREEQNLQLSDLLVGYEEFCDFNRRELALIEPLRTLRLLYYCGWLARRWDDPAFPRNFPWFNTPRYWEQQIIDLQEQLERLEHDPLCA